MISAALRLGGALSGLAEYRQFILYRVVPATPKPRKLPTSPLTGATIDAHDSTHWVDAETALAAAEKFGINVGFVFTAADPFWVVDIDGALVDGKWSDTATALCQYFTGAAIEVSVSGTGLHIIGRGVAPPHCTKNGPLGLEFYTDKRGLIVTGTNATGGLTADWSTHLGQLIPAYFPPSATPAPAEPGAGRNPAWRGPEDDDELIGRMMRSRPSAGAAFGTKATFADLWNADADALARVMPDATGVRPYDASTADMTLALHLAWWTGGDTERIERLMRRSGLVRDKWDQHATYLREFTIPRAVGSCSTCYVETPAAPPPPAPIAATVPQAPVAAAALAPRPRGSTQYLSPEDQIGYFAGCIYIRDMDRILTPNGMIMGSSQFNNSYSGVIFKTDNENTKMTAKAWDAFVLSQAYEKPTVDRTYFNPNHAPRNVTYINGFSAINTWEPKFGERVDGDVTPFLRHIALLLPDPADQRILLAWMAASVQFVGVKFRWAVVLQGVEGNGKSLTAECLAYALGKAYVHSARASQLTQDKFNSWMLGKLLIIVNDMKADPKAQSEAMEVLKPMISETDQPIRAMQRTEETLEVFCNYMFTMNDIAGFPKNRNDRRYCIFITEQQHVEDIERCGMGARYFKNLTDWLKNGGFAAVAHYLANVDIPEELNPAGLCQRAPETSRLAEVLQAGLSGQAQVVLEAIASGEPGMQGGYISGAAAMRVLSQGRMAAVGPRGLARLMNEIGYVPHPGLEGGRAPRAMTWDNGSKPIVYVKQGHMLMAETNRDLIMDDYIKSQGMLQFGHGGGTIPMPVPS